MELKQAIAMLSGEQAKSTGVHHWTDLGCGNGTFTMALAALLKKGSIIDAVDSDESALSRLPAQSNGIEIRKTVADFTNTQLPFQNLDGILMANSLHYVKNQSSFVQKAKGWLKSTGCFLIVEYDTSKANKWVPWPVEFDSLEKLFYSAGFQFIRKIAEQPSVYGKANLYPAMIKR